MPVKPSLTLCRIGESDDAELCAMAYQYWEDLMPHAAVIRGTRFRWRVWTHIMDPIGSFGAGTAPRITTHCRPPSHTCQA